MKFMLPGTAKAGVMTLIMTLMVASLIGLPTKAQAQSAVLLAVGDIASCTTNGDEKVAELLAKTDGIIALLGDITYNDGLEQTYKDCFEPAWGPLKPRFRPTPGNHDYVKAKDTPYYFTYFGEAAGVPDKGFYSYNYGTWHIVVLNSMVPDWKGTEQYEWLKADLAANPVPCILAYWHHPMFHSGAGGITGRMKASFRQLYDAGASVLLSGDAHHYERMAPMNISRRIERTRGIRQFIVGTGGTSTTRLLAKWPATEARDNLTYGVLRLILNPGSYEWEFLPIEGKTFTDKGAAPCSVKE